MGSRASTQTRAADSAPRPARRRHRLALRWPRRASAAPGTCAATEPRQVYILPTRAGLGYALVLLAMLLGSLNYQNNLALLLTFLMIAASVVSMHHCWFHLLALEVAVRDGAAVFPGQTAHFPIRVQERGGKPRPGLCIVDAGCIDLAADGDAQMRLRRVARQRGPLTLGSVEIETRYPLGLFRAWTRVSLSASVLVYPAPAAYAPSPGLAAVSERRGSGDLGRGAEDFVGPRAYQPGDSPRRVDWKALARERGLVVKQFGGDRSARVLIDWDEVRAADDESRLSLLARQILDAHERGCGYGLRLPGLEIKQDRGEPHKHRCLAALARYPDHV